MNLRDIPLTTIDGESASLGDYPDSVILVVNVASRCGFTPQYEQLEELQRKYGSRNFTVMGFPCNQFLAQEPGTAAEIKEFCSLNYGVTFPLMQKVKVNGRGVHPLFAELKRTKDANGRAGLIKWNFEKFVISPTDEVSRFRSAVSPTDPALVAAIEHGLTG